MSSFISEHIFYEIAMSIGNSMDLGVMVKEVLSTYLRKLNCLAGAVLQQVEDNQGNTSFVPVYAIPKRMQRNSAVREGLETIPANLNPVETTAFLDELPVSHAGDNHTRYLMELPGYGLLLLVKSAPGFTVPELKTLAPINAKLAGACLFCSSNERLQKEIGDREKAEEKYRSIFDNAVEGIFRSSLGGRLLDANPAMAKMMGFASPEELVAKYTDMGRQLYVHQADRERFLSRLNSRGQVSAFEVEYQRNSGRVGWLAISARLIRDEHGKPLFIEGMADDITARRQAVVALREAKKEAERLSQLKSSFLSMVSHELRTPLTAILGFSKITRKKMAEVLQNNEECPAEVANLLRRIDTNTEVVIAEGDRLTELINNVLDLAKLEAGWFEWCEADVSMNLVLAHSIAATEVLFGGAYVRFSSDIEEDLPMVTGDHDRLIQLVINLLSNAAKFTEEGSVHLSCGVEGKHVVVRVADTGIGVPEEELTVIFDKFRQLGNTLTDRPRGTGLGLPICKEIVEHHKGRFWVESREGEGSLFAFSLPVKAA